ncbi:MAG: hypothetical protein QM330_09785 [Acidobacteriota bacterium]|jgi:hypothetical protein|nr:hypothetical protein [Acidobacteriota bacterium]
MNKVYYVTIQGRTLESRNLKLLLSRAVAAKKSLDREARCGLSRAGHPSREEGPDLYSPSCRAVGA